jgi:hypothetical protein
VALKSTKKEIAKHSTSDTNSNASNDDVKAGSKRKVKGKKSSEIVHSDSESESKETDDDSIDENAPPTKKSRAKKAAAKKAPTVGNSVQIFKLLLDSYHFCPQTTDAESKSDETIKRLKSYINKCGIRKIW